MGTLVRGVGVHHYGMTFNFDSGKVCLSATFCYFSLLEILVYNIHHRNLTNVHISQ